MVGVDVGFDYNLTDRANRSGTSNRSTAVVRIESFEVSKKILLYLNIALDDH